MPGIASTKYAASKNILIGGVARAYSMLNYDPRVVSGLLNSQNVISIPRKPFNGFSKMRTYGYKARKVPDETLYNRAAFERIADGWVTAGIEYTESGAASDPNKGIILDPTVVEGAFSAQDISYGTGDYIANINTLKEALCGAMHAVFEKSLKNFLPSLYADIRLKKNYDTNPESGAVLTFAADTINATYTSTVDISDATGTMEEKAAIGAEVVREWEIAARPIVMQDPSQTPRIVCNQSYFWQVRPFLEAFKSLYSPMRRIDDTNSSGTLDFVQRITYEINGLLLVPFPDDGFPTYPSTSPTGWRFMILSPHAILHAVNSVPIVASTEVAIDVGGYAPSTNYDMMENLDSFYSALGQETSAGFRDMLNLKGTDRDIINNVMNNNMGKNGIFNYVRNTVERLPMGAGTEAKHYYINSTIGEGTLRVNPYLMREFQVPYTLVEGTPPPPFSAGTTRKAMSTES